MPNADLHNRFIHHSPSGVKLEKHQQVREDFESLAQDLDIMLPEGREKALAMTNLEQAMFWANAAIARAA